MQRKNIQSGTKWESLVGYSRAVRVGKQVYISGTTAFDASGQIVGKNDPHAQTEQIIRTIENTLKKEGGSLKDVVRTRIFVVNIDNWQEIGKAQGEFFADIKPATSMIEVKRLIQPDILVEIEADAVLNQ